MRFYVISDLHLKFSENSEDRKRRERVLNFLDSLIGKADILVLNGDIFDLWFAWNRVIIKSYFPILKKFADIRESGCKIYFTAGNHDFWFRDFLSQYLGFSIHQNNLNLVIDGKKILIAHGDQYTSNDLRYKIFRSIIRNKIVMWIFQIIHPDLALNIGKTMSRSSRNRAMSPQLKEAKAKGLESYAIKQLNKDSDVVIMGHSHSPVLKEFDTGLYINSGDWIKHNTYIEAIDGKFQLKIYKE